MNSRKPHPSTVRLRRPRVSTPGVFGPCGKAHERARQGESVGIFYLDRDSFDAQLNLLVSAGDNFDSAKNKFYDGVRESSEIWSELNELDQFGLLLRDSLASIDDRLGQISSRYKGIVSDLQQAVQNFTEIDESERKDIMTKLNELTDKFSFISTNTPER